MSPSLGTPTPFTVTCHQVSAQTLAAAPRRGQPVCRTCRSAPCPSLPPSHPSLSTSLCLASGVPSHPHSFVCSAPSSVCSVYWTCRCHASHAQNFTRPFWKTFQKQEHRVVCHSVDSQVLDCQRVLVLLVATCCHLCLVSMLWMLLRYNTICQWCIDPTACHTLGVRESQMPNTSPTSAKTVDQEATRGKVIKKTSVCGKFVQTSCGTVGK